MFANKRNAHSTLWRLAGALAILFASLALVACKSNSSTASSADEPAATGEVHEFTLEAYLSGYKGVGGDIDGEVNPDLNVNAGDTVKVTLINKENMAHDFALEKADLQSDMLMKVNERSTFTFTAKANDTYFCSVPGHRQAGMFGNVVVSGGDDTPVADKGHHDSLMPAATNKLDPAKKVDIEEVGHDAVTIPPPLDRRHNETVEFVIESRERTVEIEDGTTFELWTYNDTVPGPMLRVKEGDDVIVHVDNAEDSSMSHSIDFHSVTGPGGGAAVLQVPPGERRSLQFKALQAGLYVYHCATPHIPTHLARGMYGMILVEPKEGLSKVDREYYVMQGEYYTKARPGTKGHQVEDSDRLFEEMHTYVVMNGRVGSLTGERALKANVGETVRIFFGVGGPNTHSAFHVIGEIFDRVYTEAAIVSEPARNVQTTAVPPGGATMVEFQVDYPGSYLLVDHALSRLDKGAVGILEVEGQADPTIFKSLDGVEAKDNH